MKKPKKSNIKSLISCSLLFFLIFTGIIAWARELKPFVFTFTGRWQSAENAALLDPGGFQDIQNMRKAGKGLKGVSGHSKINSSVWNATYLYPKNGYHFKKDQPAESHVIILGAESDGSNGQLYENTTAIPSTGSFTATAVHSDDSSAGLGRFASVPQGQMLYCNGEESIIWGGDESLPVAFLVCETSGVTEEKDYSSQVRNDLQTSDEVAVIGGGIDSDAVLVLHCDGTDGSTTFTDSSDSSHTVTARGNAQVDTDNVKFGSGSAYFDGTDDYLDAPDSADFDMDTGDFTIDFWVWFAALPTSGNGTAFFVQYDGISDYVYFYLYNNSGTYELRFHIDDSGAETDVNKTWSTPVTHRWYHIALIRGWGGASTSFAITVNGVSLGSETGVSDDWPDLTSGVSIATNGLAAADLSGYLDEYRISKGIARWTTNFTPPARQYSDDNHYWLVGFYRPIQGCKFYVGDGNTTASTMSAWEWNGDAWNALTITDNTDTGASLATTGTVTFSSTVDTSRPKFEYGMLLYWYLFYIDAGSATIYKCTVDAPMQDITNIWNGDTTLPISFHIYNDSAWEDYTTQVQYDSTEEYDSDGFEAVFSGHTTVEYTYLGSSERLTAFRVGMGGTRNSTTAAITVYYWDGSNWVSVGTVNDETSVSGASLASDGFISWNAPLEEEEYSQFIFGANKWSIEQTEWVYDYHEKQYVEQTTTLNFESTIQSPQAYYYKLMWNGALTANTAIDTIECVPRPEEIKGYDFPGNFRGRAWLFGENSGEKNKAMYSQYNSPDIWNGDDSGALWFGNDSELTAACVLYNVFRTTGYEQLIVTKANETYRVIGDGPEDWQLDQMSGNVGCIAPLSMAVCEIADISEDTRRHVAIWQSSSGVVMCDGASIVPISEDISNYWDPNSSDYIPASQQDDSVGFYDPNLQAYKLLISSGSGVTNLNVELEYSLKYNEWTKIYRENAAGANPLQCGFQVHDTDGNVYTYGATDEGYMYRLENGNDWDSVADIAQYVQTGNIMLDQGAGMEFFNETTIMDFRLLYEDKDSSSETITIAHYHDDTLTVDGTNNQDVPSAINFNAGPWDTQTCLLGPARMHSFKISSSVDDVADGMELFGMGFMYESSSRRPTD